MGTPKRGNDPARPTKGTQELFSTDEVAVFVPHGKYTFTMTDVAGDGAYAARRAKADMKSTWMTSS